MHLPVLTQTAPLVRNGHMAFLAHILGLFRCVAACAVILALGFSLPSAAHSIAGHHGQAAVADSGGTHADAAMLGMPHETSQTGEHDGRGAPVNSADSGNCCSVGCMSLAVLSLQPEQQFLSHSLLYKAAASQLPSQPRLALRRPPRS